MTLVLTLRETPTARVDAAAIRPDLLAGLDTDAVRALPLRHGREAVALGDLFDVFGRGEAVVRVRGDLTKIDRLAEAMQRGELHVDGPVGDHLGARMSGGEVSVNGDAGAYAAAEMRGGLLRIDGDAGVGLASAYPGTREGMRAGEVLVSGDAGDEAGSGMRRGFVAVGGRVGDGAALRMLAGTLVALGGFGADAGLMLRRGTLVSAGPIAIPSTYGFACRYVPPALRLQLLRARHLGLDVDDALLDAVWSRWSGDRLELAKGEILTLDGPDARPAPAGRADPA